MYHSGIGVFARHTFGNTVAHNHIHDFYYSGISCGWVWGYSDSVSQNNRFEKNHIHSLGKGWLSDMGGIYTLGVQPGTRHPRQPDPRRGEGQLRRLGDLPGRGQRRT